MLFLVLQSYPIFDFVVILKVVMKHNAVIEHLKQKKTLTPAEREENQR